MERGQKCFAQQKIILTIPTGSFSFFNTDLAIKMVPNFDQILKPLSSPLRTCGAMAVTG
jgi:hypothetical protein